MAAPEIIVGLDAKVDIAEFNSVFDELNDFENFADLEADAADYTARTAGNILRVRNGGLTYEVAASAATDHNLVTAGGVKLYVLPGVKGYNVRAFGAVGDGVADDSVAIKAAFTAASRARITTAVGFNPATPRGIYFPGGEYRVTQPRTMMDANAFGRIIGMTYTGESAGTTINFDFDGDDYLFYNDNQFLTMQVRGLRFTCNSDLSKLWYSNADGGAQDYLFEFCSIEGTWQKLYVLRGVNNNSEGRWNSCSITPSIRDVVMDVADSDQFLNYWFNSCKLWLRDGQMLRSTRGGHFHFVMCDFSGLGQEQFLRDTQGTPGIDHMSLNQSTNGAPMFELLGRTHARGVCNFSATLCRFEHKLLSSWLMYCEWPQGAVTFNHCDFISNLPVGYDTRVHARFDRGNTSGPQVTFNDCKILGVHQYETSFNGFLSAAHAKYEKCQIVQPNPDAFIDQITTTNVGSNWCINIDQCTNFDAANNNPGSGDMIVWNVAYGRRGQHSFNKGKTFTFMNAQGQGTPLSTNELAALLPAGSYITQVTFRNTGELTSTTSVNFEVRDGAGTVIAASGAQTLNTAFVVDVPVAFKVPTGQERIVVVDANGAADQAGGSAWVTVTFES